MCTPAELIEPQCGGARPLFWYDVSVNDETLDALRKWVENWKETGVILRRIRREELRRLDTTAVREWMVAFEDAFEDAIRRFPPGPSSGLIEQQDWFKGFRR